MALTGYVQIPPDGTGKRILHGVTVEIEYSNGTIAFNVGDIVTGATSGITGTVVKVVGSVISGDIYVHLDGESVTAAVIGENLQVSSVTNAKAANIGTVTYKPSISISDHENPFYGQRINYKGAASTTFTEGEPTLDAFGNLRVAQCRAIGVYEHTQRSYDDLFSTITGSGGSATHQPTVATYLLSCNSTATAAVTRTSNRYHYYLPGTGLLTIVTLGLSDSGRQNNIRQWGYFDNNNGLFFELSSSTLSVVVRRDGVDTKTHQNNWNGDKLDGTGLSGFNLNLTTSNFYWIDMAWLGVGEVRFGILNSDGERIVAHTNLYSNTTIGPYMNTPHLPVSWKNYNTGITSGTSDIQVICAAVYSDSNAEDDYTFWRSSDVETTSSGITVTNRTPLFSIRNNLTNFMGSGYNRVSIYPETLAIHVEGGSVKLEHITDPDSITGANWQSSSVSTANYDNQGSAVVMGTGGSKLFTLYLGPGDHNVNISQYYELNDEALVLRANGAYRTYSYALTKISGSTVTAQATLNYRELS